MLFDNLNSAPFQDHEKAINNLINVNDRVVLDIGCGAGRIARILAKNGGRVIGIDPSVTQLDRAKALSASNTVKYVRGLGESLPVRNSSIDFCIFFNSLHHVPSDYIERAIHEAGLSLKKNGILYVAEPIAYGPLFELSKSFNDETIVREKAYSALVNIKQSEMIMDMEHYYQSHIYYSSFEEYKKNSISIDTTRSTFFSEHDKELRKSFETLGEKIKDAWCFTQYTRVNIFHTIK